MQHRYPKRDRPVPSKAKIELLPDILSTGVLASRAESKLLEFGGHGRFALQQHLCSPDTMPDGLNVA